MSTIEQCIIQYPNVTVGIVPQTTQTANITFLIYSLFTIFMAYWFVKEQKKKLHEVFVFL